MMRWLKSLFCNHTLDFVRNISGDEIIMSGYNRSVWRCTKCKKFVLRPELHNGDY